MFANLEPLSDTPAVYAFVIVLGLLFGSFANVCIYRWPPSDEFPKGRSVVLPGSHCFACKTPIRWYDNTPLLSYLWLRGRCRACDASFSPRYLFVEGLTGLLFGATWWFAVHARVYFEPFDTRLLRFVIDAAFVFVMVVITFIDIDHKLILNKVTIPAIPIFYGLGLLLPENHWYDGLVGAALGYGLPWTIGEIYYRVTKREGLGLGDSMLLAVIGALLGWPGVIVSLFGGSMIGSVIGIAMVIGGRRVGDDEEDEADEAEAPAEPLPDAPAPAPAPADPSEPEPPPSMLRAELPFGPFLVAGALFYLFAAEWITIKFALLGH